MRQEFVTLRPPSRFPCPAPGERGARGVAFLLLAATFAATASCHEDAVSSANPEALGPAPSAAPSAISSATPGASSVAAANVGFVPLRVTDNEQHAMGTHLAFTAYTTPQVDATQVRAAFAAAVAEIQRIETAMTTWRPDSELSKVNAAAGEAPVHVSQETYDVIAESVHTSEISEGTFDITFESLHGLWKFDQDLDPHPPTDAQVKAKLPLLSYHHIHLAAGTKSGVADGSPEAGEPTVFLDKKGVRISLGGIAKGYAVDRASKVLLDRGIDSFFVQAGGDLYTHGKKADGSDWSAGVRDPRGPEGSYFALLGVSDHAFSTAGDYERSYIVNGRRYHHIIDPRTGYPATASRSVTIWAPTALQADALDDAVFILGPEKGLALVESQDGVGAVIVDAHNKVWVSPRLQGKLELIREPTDAL
jgi:thiamine biosynthesis lipoprotein